MDKLYKHNDVEKKWYQVWEDGGYFQPKIDKSKKPFTILLPLPNANDPIHVGHALFTVEDIMIRYHRMRGDPTLWLPGADHAGIETQFVFEKKLAKEGKSRFDFDRETLYKMIYDFVEKNRSVNRDQLKRMGFSLDWSRYHYSLEPLILETVLNTFKKLHKDGLVYRGERMVNFCTKCGTAFSDLEVDFVEREDFLYFLDYGVIQIATTRPETIFADTAVAVNPKDLRYKSVVGKMAVVPIINKEVPVLSDNAIDIKFGTGALKVTPGHDRLDFEIGERHKLPIVSVIDTSGRMTNLPEKYIGLRVNKAREAVILDLKRENKIIKILPLKHMVGVCYRCGTVIEPLISSQWFIKIKPLAEKAIQAVKDGRTKIVPKKRFEKMYFDWLENIYDWNIGRQIVWGPRIPVWYCLDCNKDLILNFIDKNGAKISGKYQRLKEKYSFGEIKGGLQSLTAGKEPIYTLEEGSCKKCGSSNVLQETDTFDTWFLSGQWPLTTLGYPDSEDFKYFYPTSVLDTLWDILFFWVARMMMLGLYLTNEVPFRVVHLHARVVDKTGQKMSKSKGNVINPIEMADKYGADALRMALILGVGPASDICLSEEKVVGMRNFGNKIWNAARFVLETQNSNVKTPANVETTAGKQNKNSKLKTADINNENDKNIIEKLNITIKEVTKDIEYYRFGRAAETIYEFFWHEFCDKYIESTKDRRSEAQLTLKYVLAKSMQLLHPFMPFITEEIWSKIPKEGSSPILVSDWPMV